ncbi:MAG: twin-arginine translocase subunit TatC [Planctomycetota bacterium]|jgi:sec-independent protein translocase protein TatC|nr:twin-arginine translocase subunit TatC [Planctomycetia bacterium]MDO7678979.1 twin-arginine translocase subunit TatC [Pirellulales bacterium]RLS33051.1 MAG: twin-arginine translocase subunit TatC [Planctomycetota bacterium]RLS60952.1 MAG: twin-arginine translocase subunit TatC [Planctomycetota bacterium]TSA06007.1 MAG: twin-arginine translocase subunit TatC [Planctomycetaceae bacterium]
MARQNNDDLFQSSTMTFGEHLEELRSCLMRASAGLFFGVLIGFFVARPVVHLIEQPLRRALGNYYIERSLEAFDEWKPRVANGPALPYTRFEVEDAVERYGMSFDLREIHTDRILKPIPHSDAGLQEGVPTPFDPATLAPVLLWQPLSRDSRVSITTLSAQEAFGIYVKAALLVGVVLAGPWIIYQLWTFVAAGLYPHEKHWVHLFLPISTGLFLAGVGLAFFFVFDFVLQYLLAFNEWLGLDPDPRISEWLGFVLILPIGFGLGFQLPLVMLFLERVGIFDVETYATGWRVAVIVIFVVSAILTPADPYSLLFLALPLCVLYFGGLGICRWFPRDASENSRSLSTRKAT